MNNVYFVRHAIPDFSIKDELLLKIVYKFFKKSELE